MDVFHRIQYTFPAWTTPFSRNPLSAASAFFTSTLLIRFSPYLSPGNRSKGIFVRSFPSGSGDGSCNVLLYGQLQKEQHQ